MSNKHGSRLVRDEVPLLPHNVSKSSDAVLVFEAGNNPIHNTRSALDQRHHTNKLRNGLGRVISSLRRKSRTKEPLSTSIADVRPVIPTPVVEPTLEQSKRVSTASQLPNTRLLDKPKNDTPKKIRPFPVPIRRRTNASSKVDPPTEKDCVDSTANDEEKKTDEGNAMYTAVQNADHPQSVAGANNNKLQWRNSEASYRAREDAAASPNSATAPAQRTDERTQHPTSPTPKNSTHNAEMTRELEVLALLNRPFGRAHLPIDIARRFVADVSQAEWNDDEQRWKYRVLLQKRNLNTAASSPAPSSFTAAFTWRSLADFQWLEQALQQEFHGGLLLPNLNVAVGQAPGFNLQGMPVEADKLKHWLNDVLNGIRGQGELILDHAMVDIMHSEAMEKFLYKTGALKDEDGDDTSLVDVSHGAVAEKVDESFMYTLWNRPLSIVPLDFCVGPQPDTTRDSARARRTANHMPLGFVACSSRAIGNAASLDAQDSLAADCISVASSTRPSSVLAVHSELLETERELLYQYQRAALSAMERIRLVTEEEELLGHNWTRFATCLSNLFAYEKAVENARICDIKLRKENLAYRQIAKDEIDDRLLLLAKCKSERSAPAFKALSSMLTAYLADLSAVGPALDAYAVATRQLILLHDKAYDEASSAASSQKQSQTLTNTEALVNGHFKNTEGLFIDNERLLLYSTTELCRGVPLRMSRMAWKYWNAEVSQCALLSKAAHTLKAKLDVVTADCVVRMNDRHLKEETIDAAAELELIERILNVGTLRSKVHRTDDVFCDNSGPRSQAHGNIGSDVSIMRRRVLSTARERIGRWNSALSVAIMELVGVDDPDVLVGQTSKDIRLVEEYATGLRSLLSRCIEAVEQLRASYIDETPRGENEQDRAYSTVSARRGELFTHLTDLFSGKPDDEAGTRRQDVLSLAVLRNSGIDITDPIGWSGGGKLRGLAEAAMKPEDAQASCLLNGISELLSDYSHRVEVIEGFVHMECVGIQLEKHYSQLRAHALEALERKTDITTAMNVATRKGLKELVHELQQKLAELGPEVSHTLVKETKDMHLESKNLKSELRELAVRRLTRVRESSTGCVVELMSIWANEEERAAKSELKSLTEALDGLRSRMVELLEQTVE